MKNEPVCIIDLDGIKRWYLDTCLHREDGPAVEYPNGAKYWYINNSLHRENGPAIITSGGIKEWYLNDKLHRLDGPAVEYPDGRKEWWSNDHSITVEIIQWAIKNEIDLDNLSNEDKTLIKLIWSDYED